MGKNAIQNRNRIVDALSLAADRTQNALQRKALRELSKDLMSDRDPTSSERVDAELLEIAEALSGYALAGSTANIQTALARMRTLMSVRHEKEEGSEKKMGLFRKLFSQKTNKVASPDEVKRDVDSKLYKLEQEIASISEKRKKCVEELKAVIQEAAQYPPDSYDFKQARLRAGSIKKQISLYEGQIDNHYRALMSNQRYAQLIENGLAMKNLEALLPDPAEADVILDALSATVESVADQQDLLDDVMGKHKMRGGRATDILDVRDDEFDKAVREARISAAKTAEASEADPVAPAEIHPEAEPTAEDTQSAEAEQPQGKSAEVKPAAMAEEV